MPRRNPPFQATFPYHVGSRCINRDWFEMPLTEVWDLMVNQLHFVHHAFNVRIHAFVLMSNHFHLVITTPQANLDEAMRWFLRETSRSITWSTGRINHTFCGRYFRCMINSQHHYLNTYKYIYRNPVRAKLCPRAEEYPFSTLHGLIGLRRLLIPIEEDITLFNDVEGTLDWLNQTPKADFEEHFRKALKHSEIKLGKLQRRPHPLEIDLL